MFLKAYLITYSKAVKISVLSNLVYNVEKSNVLNINISCNIIFINTIQYVQVDYYVLPN